MRYFVLVERGQSKAEAFAQVLGTGKVKPSAVYVVGIEDHLALGYALTNGKLEAEEMDAKARMQFGFCEAIGTEESVGDLTRLVAAAEARIHEIVTRGSR